MVHFGIWDLCIVGIVQQVYLFTDYLEKILVELLGNVWEYIFVHGILSSSKNWVFFTFFTYGIVKYADPIKDKIIIVYKMAVPAIFIVKHHPDHNMGSTC